MQNKSQQIRDTAITVLNLRSFRIFSEACKKEGRRRREAGHELPLILKSYTQLAAVKYSLWLWLKLTGTELEM